MTILGPFLFSAAVAAVWQNAPLGAVARGFAQSCPESSPSFAEKGDGLIQMSVEASTKLDTCLEEEMDGEHEVDDQLPCSSSCKEAFSKCKMVAFKKETESHSKSTAWKICYDQIHTGAAWATEAGCLPGCCTCKCSSFVNIGTGPSTTTMTSTTTAATTSTTTTLAVDDNFDFTKDFSKHSNTHCEGERMDPPNLVGSVGSCATQCLAMRCVGFNYQVSGQFAGKCFFKGGWLSVPKTATWQEGDCYEVTSSN